MPRFTASDGTELYYRDWGRGRPVVLVHSMLMSSDMWQHQMLHLADHGFRAIAYDRRGHGRSDESATDYGFDTLADDLAALLERLDLAEVTLVGHSMGGGEVVRHLSRHGGARVSRFALVGSTVPALQVDAETAAGLVEQLRGGYGQWVEDNAALSFGDQLPGVRILRTEKDRTVQDWMRVSLRAAVECTRVNLAADFRAELRRIALPGLVVHGDSDAFAPLEVCGRRSADLIPDSRLVVYPNASHMLHLSHRARLGADLLAFASGQSPSV